MEAGSSLCSLYNNILHKTSRALKSHMDLFTRLSLGLPGACFWAILNPTQRAEATRTWFVASWPRDHWQKNGGKKSFWDLLFSYLCFSLVEITVFEENWVLCAMLLAHHIVNAFFCTFWLNMNLLTQPDSLDTEQNILVYNAWVHCVVWSSLSSLPILYIKLRGL